MPNLLIFNERKVKAKGLNNNNQVNENLKNYFFTSDYENLKLIPALTLTQKKPVLFYPGCGIDILYPLHYAEKMFPQPRAFYFYFMDLSASLGCIKTVLDDLGISFKEKKDQIFFYWKETLINLKFKVGNVFENMDHLPQIDIYFERAFRIFKEQSPNYEQIIFNKIAPNGLIISDSGFKEFPLEKINADQKLSSYREMMIGKKLKL